MGEWYVVKSIRLTARFMTALAATLLIPSWVQAEAYPYSVGMGFEFSSGKYGTSTRTDSIYAPLTITASPTDRLGLVLEIPFVYQSNGNVLSSVATGGMQSSRAMRQLAAGVGGMSGSGSGMASSSASTDQSESGLGDISLKIGYLLLPETDSLPQVRPMAFVKFPTADREKALGTGEFDEGFSLELSKWLADWNPFAEAGYSVQGKSPQLSLRNYLTYNAGVGYQMGDHFRPVLLVKGATPPAEGASSLLEVRLKLKYQPTRRIGCEGYLAKGITSNSPDYGIGLSAFYSF
jgi:hypothetical protein